MPRADSRCLLLLLGGFVWVVLTAGGFLLLLRYKTEPGEVGAAACCWPASSQVVPVPGMANLILPAHPRCPCTAATLGELARLMTFCQGRVAAHVLFCRPAGVLPGWEKSDLWDSATAIPGVRVLADEDGAEARCFGAATSGHVFLYDAAGKLIFSGGITSARGHAGDNTGLTSIVNLLTLRQPAQIVTPVFGCPLHDACIHSERGSQPCKP
jgi:hypothetical protein